MVESWQHYDLLLKPMRTSLKLNFVFLGSLSIGITISVSYGKSIFFIVWNWNCVTSISYRCKEGEYLIYYIILNCFCFVYLLVNLILATFGIQRLMKAVCWPLGVFYCFLLEVDRNLPPWLVLSSTISFSHI